MSHMTLVVGLDPAPQKASTVFDGSNISRYDAENLEKYIFNSGGKSVLVCCDAPLTGPQNPDDSIFIAGDHTQRPIESFFRQSAWGVKTPKGISVRGYAGCPHWTITRRMFGLPRVGRWDLGWDQLPFQLITRGGEIGGKAAIIEVHPAIAIWLWCKNSRPLLSSWEYKSNENVLHGLWGILKSELPKSVHAQAAKFEPASDDDLDAFIAWALGYCWLKDDGVILLGNRRTGALLLPNVSGIDERFKEFTTKNGCE